MDSSQETRKENENIKSLVLTEVADKKKKKKRKKTDLFFIACLPLLQYICMYI